MHTLFAAFTLARRPYRDPRAEAAYSYLCARLARTRAMTAPEIAAALTAQARAIAQLLSPDRQET